MVLGFLGNVAGNLNQDAFQKGTTDELNLQALQRAEQNRLNREFFREKQGGPPPLPTPEALNQGMAGLNIDRFGGTYIDVPPPVVTPPDDPFFDGEEGDGTGEDQTTDTTKPVVTDPNQLKPSDPVIIDEPDLSFPKVDPNQTELPPAKTGRNQKNPERSAEIVRRQTIDNNTNAILKQYGIRRKAGQGSKNITKQQGDAFNFYNSKEFKDFIYQYPQYLTEVSEDPFGFMEKYMAEKEGRTTSTVISETSARTKKLISGRIQAIDNDILNSTNSKKLVELANSMGVDPIAALAIFGIESDFGRNVKKSQRAAFGSMQVTNAQFNNLKKWFADPANRAQIEAIYPNNPGMVDKVIGMVANMQRAKARASAAGNEGELVAGLAQLIYNKAINLPKNLWGAGYQGNANKVRDNKGPLAVSDGNISNSDYNSAYVSLYNYIAGKMGGSTMTASTATAANQNTQTTTSSAAANNQAAGQTSTTTNQSADQQIAGLNIQDVQTDTTGQSTNTGNTGTASTDVSSLKEQTTGVDTGGTKTEETVPKTNEKVEPPAFYTKDPSRLGFDLRNYLEERELVINQTNRNVQILAQRADYFRRLAEVSRIGGTDEASYNKLLNQSTELMAKAQTMQQAGALEAKKAENKIMYLQGMQGLQDLANGSVNRAAAVWSEYSGMDIRINPRSDGKYDITLNGKPYKTMDFSTLSNTLQLAFDQGYRKTQQEASATRALKTFEAQLEITKDNMKAYNERQKEVLKGRIDIIKEREKQQGDVKLEFDSNGVPYKIVGDQIFVLETYLYEDQNGDEQVGYREIPVIPGTTASANAYKRPEK